MDAAEHAPKHPAGTAVAEHITRIGAAIDDGEKSFYRITELFFEDQGALQAGFGSDEGKATAADYQKIAPPGSRMFVVPVDD